MSTEPLDGRLELQLELDDADDLRGRLAHAGGWERSFRGTLGLLAAIEDARELRARLDP